ncbi:hypothetical protein XENOCAPTIV_007083, partial [Xenoophorus captivus]
TCIYVAFFFSKEPSAAPIPSPPPEKEELKERARLLLEQARRDAAMKAGNKNATNSAVTAPNRTSGISDVSPPPRSTLIVTFSLGCSSRFMIVCPFILHLGNDQSEFVKVLDLRGLTLQFNVTPTFALLSFPLLYSCVALRQCSGEANSMSAILPHASSTVVYLLLVRFQHVGKSSINCLIL